MTKKVKTYSAEFKAKAVKKIADISSAIAFLGFFIVRTEASSFLWYSFERYRMYASIFIMLMLSIVVNIIKINHIILFLVYIAALLITILLFKDNSKVFLHFVSRSIKKHKL